MSETLTLEEVWLELVKSLGFQEGGTGREIQDAARALALAVFEEALEIAGPDDPSRWDDKTDLRRHIEELGLGEV